MTPDREKKFIEYCKKKKFLTQEEEHLLSAIKNSHSREAERS